MESKCECTNIYCFHYSELCANHCENFDLNNELIVKCFARNKFLNTRAPEGKGFDYAKNFLEISLSKAPYAEVEKVCGAGVLTTLFYLREFAKQKGK